MINKLAEINGSIIRQAKDEQVFCYRSGACINADGAYHAYHPEKGKGLDYLANAGEPGNWWGISCDVSGRPYIQQSNHPAPGYYISTTSLCDTAYPASDPRRFVDSESVPFIVLPTSHGFGAKLGDFAMVCNGGNGKYCAAIYADNGPVNKIGEISIALAKELGVNPDPKSGGSEESDFLYVVFPGSRKGWPLPVEDFKLFAHQAFVTWGGFQKLATFYPALISEKSMIVPPSLQNYKEEMDKVYNQKNQQPTTSPMTTPTPIARLTVTNSNGTPLKIGDELKAKKDLQDHEYIDLPCGKTVELSKVVSLNDRSHYRVEAIGNSGESRLAWVYVNDAGIEYLDGTGGESHTDIYAAPKKDVKPIDPSDKKAIQRELSRVGLLDGRKGFDDGKWGGLSESAMRAWKRHYGSDDTVKALAGLQQAKGFKELDLRPKDPNKTSHKIATACLKRMLELDMWLAVSFGSESPAWNFFYLSGTNADGSFNKDLIDNMNDLRFLAKINPDGTVEVGYISVATWDAGWKYRKDRMNSNGCFQVDYDKQFWSWRPGTHGTAAPHAALTQQDDGDPLTGTRDDDENGRTSTDKHYDDGGAVNHHGTVGRRPGQPIGPYSAGCGVDDDIDAHLNIFMPKIKADRRVKASYGHLINSCFLDRSKVKGLPLS
jgi:Fungal chitosanase of glycosyl hydrolase group 75